jgi:hypothetical protein
VELSTSSPALRSDGPVPSAASRGRLLFVSMTGCPPCREMEGYLSKVGIDAIPGLSFEHLELTENEFMTRCLSGALPVRSVPALLLYREGSLVGRIVGLRGKQGVVDGPFVVNWLRRFGYATPDSSTAPI